MQFGTQLYAAELREGQLCELFRAPIDAVCLQSIQSAALRCIDTRLLWGLGEGQTERDPRSIRRRY
jgi:hypothetical protein